MVYAIIKSMNGSVGIRKYQIKDWNELEINRQFMIQFYFYEGGTNG